MKDTTMDMGIKIMDPAADFCLIDTNENEVRLSGFKGKQNVLLVFNRGYSCPFCRRHMARLKKDYPLFQARNTEIVTVGPNSIREFKRFMQAEQLPFIGLSDMGNQVARLYFQEFNLLKFGWVPALFIIDVSGRIRFIHYGKNMADIPDNAVVLEVLDEICNDKT